MADTKFDICSTALTLAGANPIASFDDGTAEADVSRVNYEDVVLAAMTVPGGKPFRWRFCSDLRRIPAPLSDTPTSIWSYAYNLPDDMLALTGVFVSDTPISYDRYANKVLCDESDGIDVEIMFRPDEALWPKYFRTAVVYDLASRFAVALAEDPTESNRLYQIALNLYTGARTLESQQQPPRRIRGTKLINARF